jgi:hypothetical protein
VRFLTFFVSAAALALPIGATAEGQKAFGILSVHALVQPTASLKFEFRNEGLIVTPGDLVRGYVELSAASVLSIATLNLKPEITVDFNPVARLFRSLEILNEGTRTAAAGGGYPAPSAVLTYRIHLAEGALPGRYALPLTFNVTL